MKLNYKSLGSGPPLVILHGLFGSLDNWMTLAKVFAEKHTVYLVDQRNHGLSPHDSEFNYTAMANDLGEFLDDHGLQDPILLGHSMGGKTVMKFGLDRPDRWKKIVVVDIAPRAYPVHHQKILAGLNAIPVSTISSRGEAEKRLSEYVADIGQRQFLLKNLKRTPDGFAWKMNLPVIEREIEIIGEGFLDHSPVAGPVLFIRGANSDYINDSDIDSLTALFPDAGLVTIHGAGHWVHAEKPAELVKAVQDFIDA